MPLMDRQLLCETLILHLTGERNAAKGGSALKQLCFSPPSGTSEVCQIGTFQWFSPSLLLSRTNCPQSYPKSGGHLASCHPKNLQARLYPTHPLGPARPSAMEVTALLLGKFFYTIRAQTYFNWVHDDRGCSLPSCFKHYPPDWWMLAVLGTNHSHAISWQTDSKEQCVKEMLR